MVPQVRDLGALCPLETVPRLNVTEELSEAVVCGGSS